MSNELNKLRERHDTITERMRRIKEAMNTLESVLIDAEAERQKLKLEIDALRYEGDTE